MRLLRQAHVAHRDHRLDAAQRVARRVRVDGGERAVVAGVHRLQHVERFLAADLADDDAVGAHAEGVDHELALLDRAFAFDVRRPRFEPDDVLLLELQFGRVLDGDDALVLADEARQDVEQRRLAGAGAAADQAVQARAHAVAEEVEHRPRHRAERHQVLALQALLRKPPDREQRTVDGERRDDRVDARAVRQARVDHRRAVVDAAADRRHDAVDDAQQMPVVLERRRHLGEDAGALDVHLLVGVDEDVVDVRVAEQRLERAEAEDLVEDVAEDLLALGHADRRGFLGHQLEHERADFGFGALPIDGGQRLEIQAVQQLLVNVRLELDVLRARRVGPARDRPAGRRPRSPEPTWGA